MRTLVVVCHPVSTSLTRQAFARVVQGLERGGHSVEIIDLDALGFDPRLTVEEKRGHLDAPETKPQVAEHADALRWAERIVLVYPTWFGGFPARLKGWFDRAWINGVVYRIPKGSGRVHAGLRNIRRLEVVTTHGSGRVVNFMQGNPGRLTVSRMFRALCHPRCRVQFHPIYGLDRADPADIAEWLDGLEAYFSR